MAKPTGIEAHRNRILKVALDLLRKEGRDAVTTRSVAQAANVQPPVLYRLFGDKGGLLDAVVAYGFAAYLAKKRPPGTADDPVEALQAGWELHIQFGLGNPELYLLMYADSKPGVKSPAAEEALSMLNQHMQQVAAAGRLGMSVSRACALYHSAAVGMVLLLLSSAPEQRDMELSLIARDHALAAITTPAPLGLALTLSAAANQVRALLDVSSEGTTFSIAERTLLSEWLQRLVNSSNRPQ